MSAVARSRPVVKSRSIQPQMRQETGLRLLVIDDDAEDFFAIKRALRDCTKHYSFTHVTNVESAALELRSDKYDAALLDFHIGHKLATDLLRTFESDPPSMPVILLSGNNSDEIQETALEFGAFEFFEKQELSSKILSRSIDFAVKRFGIEAELRESEMRVRQAQQAADDANLAKSQFLANMSHELRTPLNAIIGFSQILKNDLLSHGICETYRDYAGSILQSGDHLLSLVNDLLDMSKIEAGEFPLYPEQFDPKVAIENAIKLCHARAQTKNLSINVDLTGGDVFVDRRAFDQVLLNLITNAIKFSNDAGKITIRSRAQPGSVEISVEDQGAGIAKSDIDKVLWPFVQVNLSNELTAKGTGLGLPISKSLVEEHGGTFWLESELGLGTIVTFELPNETPGK